MVVIIVSTNTNVGWIIDPLTPVLRLFSALTSLVCLAMHYKICSRTNIFRC